MNKKIAAIIAATAAITALVVGCINTKIEIVNFPEIAGEEEGGKENAEENN